LGGEHPLEVVSQGRRPDRGGSVSALVGPAGASACTAASPTGDSSTVEHTCTRSLTARAAAAL